MMHPQVRQCNRYLTICQTRLADAHATRRCCQNAAAIGYGSPENENRRTINVQTDGHERSITAPAGSTKPLNGIGLSSGNRSAADRDPDRRARRY